MDVLQSQVTAVTVFSRGALVRRRAVLPAGITKVRIDDLPLSMLDASLRVVSTERRAKDASVSLQVPQASDEADDALERELREAKHEERMAQHRKRAEENFAEVLEKLTITVRGRTENAAPVPIPIESRNALMDYRKLALEASDERLAELNEALRLATEARAKAEARRNARNVAIKARREELRKAVDLSVEAGDEGELFIEYQVPSCQWSPAYVLRIDENMQHAELEMRAFIAQRTGEDWRNCDNEKVNSKNAGSNTYRISTFMITLSI